MTIQEAVLAAKYRSWKIRSPCGTIIEFGCMFWTRGLEDTYARSVEEILGTDWEVVE